ncbi:hypothetical protein JHN45_30575 [Streptomyces sp. MBT53]|nr:hypothetical protein [Streptomyces sp. MBT53]
MAREIAAASLAVMLVAAGAGWLLARRITRRLVRLAEAAEEVSAEGRAGGGPDDGGLLDGRVASRRERVGRFGEVGRLSVSFGRMLDRLAAAREAQDRLVRDAAHELRTPLTSLRINADVLRRVAELSPDARDRLLDDVEGETRELTHLVDELVELALACGRDEPEQVVELGESARRAARRTHRPPRPCRRRRHCGPRPTPSARTRGGQPAGECGQVRSRRPCTHRSACPPGRDHRRRPRTGHHRRRRPARLRPLLPRRHRPRGPRLRTGPRHRPGCGRGAWRDRVRGDVDGGRRCGGIHGGRVEAGRARRLRGRFPHVDVLAVGLAHPGILTASLAAHA